MRLVIIRTNSVFKDNMMLEKVNSTQLRGYLNQFLMVILINVPAVSFGLAMGWVSLASGEGHLDQAVEEHQVVVAAVTTFTASLLGVPLGAWVLTAGRKPTVLLTSGLFILCWTLKLVGGGWWVVAARVAAGLGGALAWCVSPLLARETMPMGLRGAAVAALVLAHNLGQLIMYLAADARIEHRTILWSCLSLSLAHCMIYLCIPESPAYLAAHGRHKEARDSLTWLRGTQPYDERITVELKSLPSPERAVKPLQLLMDLTSDPLRRRALVVSLVCVVGQEACGLLALLQYAERVFMLALHRDPMAEVEKISNLPVLVTPARHAVLLGSAQLVASGLSLYLVEKVGRRPLLVWTSFLTAACLAAATCGSLVSAAWGPALTAAALALSVAADAAGMQPAPYAVLADMFHYEYRSCALMLATAAACLGNALEVFVFPVVTSHGGLPSALALAAFLTLSYAIFVTIAVPETRGKTPEEIYESFVQCDVKEQGLRKVESTNM